MARFKAEILEVVPTMTGGKEAYFITLKGFAFKDTLVDLLRTTDTNTIELEVVRGDDAA